jgi:hypothetical protein
MSTKRPIGFNKDACHLARYLSIFASGVEVV